MDANVLLTFGLLVFAGAQVWVQVRSEEQRKRERTADRDAAIDRAFQLVWAEHLRLDGVSKHLAEADLIEMAILGVLRPGDVLPRDWGKVMEALLTLSPEAGYLGGIAVTTGFDLERTIAIYVRSVEAFAKEAPPGVPKADRVTWLRQWRGEALGPWEKSVRKAADDLAELFLDAAGHNPRMKVRRRLEFSDTLESDIAKAAVAALAKGSEGSAS